uniref:TPR_REGION domain-containing protein n=1 Tax=Heterorhabditis bacteriophora TaxID=37862 RepID=A0A1I7XSA0_HETBA
MQSTYLLWDHYHALARCLELAWRSGHVDQADKYLKKAIENNPRAFVDSGYNYCRGLHEWLVLKDMPYSLFLVLLYFNYFQSISIV